MKFLGKKKGFTLIEMLIVIVIIGVLASALIPKLGSARGKAQDVARKADVNNLATALISRALDTNQSFTARCADIGKDLISSTGELKGLLTSIPSDASNKGSGFVSLINHNDLGGGLGYQCYSIKKNGNTGGGFMIVAKVETDGSANYVDSSQANGGLFVAGGTGTDYDSMQTMIAKCSKGYKVDATDSQASCTYTQNGGNLRYIYLY